MKTYACSIGRRSDYPHPAPDRTAYRVGRDLGDDDYYQVWPNRASMARSIRMQQRREAQRADWKPMVALGLSEGY